jgi:PAS domain S-box-containing protein
MLQELLQQLNWSEIVVMLIMSAGGAALVWYRKRLTEWKRFWSGVLDGLRSIPELKADVRGIRYYVAPNGGGSMMDSMKRTEAAVGAFTEQVDIIVRTMSIENDSDDIGRFHCDSTGRNTYINQTYARWLAVGKAELMGWDFINFIHPDDAVRVRAHWDICRAEHRQYHSQHRMVASTGKTIEVDVSATPIPDAAPAKRWVGTLRRIDNDHEQIQK